MVTVPARPFEVKPRSNSGAERDAVHAVGVRDFAGDRAGVHVENDNLCAARNEQAASGRVKSDVVPAALAAERNLLQQMIAGGTGRRRRG